MCCNSYSFRSGILKKIFLNIKTVWRDFSHCAFSCQSWWGFSRSRGWSDFSFHFCKINFQNTRHFFVVVFLLMFFCLFFFCFYDSLLIYNIWITISLFFIYENQSSCYEFWVFYAIQSRVLRCILTKKFTVAKYTPSLK